MPKSPRWKKEKHYNNGGGQTSQKSWWEVLCNGKQVRVLRGRNRKTPCTVGWTEVKRG